MDGILAYGSAAKAKLKSIEKVQRRILEEIFVMHRMNDTQRNFNKRRRSHCFELFLVELIKELFIQIRLESPQQLWT